MSQWQAAFAGFRLPNRCHPKAQAEPKRNILRILENDFRP
jgi:hypothetical protein